MIQLQSILHPRKEVCEVPELYYHRAGKRINFDGYFNLFYLEKRKKYTSIENLILDITLQGYDSLILVHDGADIDQIPLKAEACSRYQIAFPYEAYEKGVFSFSLIESDETTASEHVAEGFYISDPGECRKVNIGIDICTYRREAYVERNLRQLKERLLEQDELNVSQHIHIYVIDNGKTLHEHESIQELVKLSAGKIRIIPNKNAGGAGGFTRGMLEVLNDREKKSLTHILLMDDDAVVEPDTLVRIYGFLSTVKEEWKNITIGGTMLREDYPYMLYCAGEWWEAGLVTNTALHLDLREFQNAAGERLTGTGDECKRYSGWWCCCYSLEAVRDDNLPVPLFIHHDDIEFGLRNIDRGTVFLNGIGVWHKGFELTFPGTNMYYDVRNNLIEIALHQEHAKKRAAFKYLTKAFIQPMLRLKDRDILMIRCGVMDFLKGPVWLGSQDPVRLHEEIREMCYRMKPLQMLEKELNEKERDFVMRQIEEYEKALSIERIIMFRKRRLHATWLHYLTFNGWLLPADRRGIYVEFPMTSPYDLFRKKRVLLYEPSSRKGVFLERRYRQLLAEIGIFLKTMLQMTVQFDRAVEDYQKNSGKITTRDAWERYLELK